MSEKEAYPNKIPISCPILNNGNSEPDPDSPQEAQASPMDPHISARKPSEPRLDKSPIALGERNRSQEKD